MARERHNEQRTSLAVYRVTQLPTVLRNGYAVCWLVPYTDDMKLVVVDEAQVGHHDGHQCAENAGKEG